MPANATRTPHKRLWVRWIAVAGLVLGAVFGTALSASAHHPEITAKTDCTGDVSWTSTAWQTKDASARTNPSILIEYRTDGGAWKTHTTVAYNAGNNFSSSGVIRLGNDPLPGSVQLRATATAKWANGAAAGDSRSTEVKLFDGCSAKPSADILPPTCETGWTVKLTNTGTVPVTFTVGAPSGPEEVLVAGGKTVTKTYSLPEDQASTVVVLAPGMKEVSRSATVYDSDCARSVPSAEILPPNCDNDWTVKLTNTGNESVTFTVGAPDGPEQVVVPGGKTVTRTYRLPEDQSSTLTVIAPGMTEVSRTATVDQANCQYTKPSAAVSHTCEQGYTASLDNSGSTEPVEFSVTGPDDAIQMVVVPAGEKRSVTLALPEDHASTVTVAAEGTVLATDSATAEESNCERPAATLRVDCTEGWNASMTNVEGVLPVLYTVTNPDGTTETITVPPNETRTWAKPIVDNTTQSATITALGLEPVTESFTAACATVLPPTTPPVTPPVTPPTTPPTTPPSVEPPVVNPPAGNPRAATPPSSVVAAPQAASAPSAGVLPATGAPAHVGLLTGFAVALLGGGALLLGRRRKA